MDHSITFNRTKAIRSVESGLYSKCPGVFLSPMRWDGWPQLALSMCYSVLVNVFQYILKSTSFKDRIFANWFNGSFCFHPKFYAKSQPWLCFLAFLTDLQGFASASSFIQLFVEPEPALSPWQLCSLLRIISLLQAVVIAWIFKLSWQKKSLPARRGRLKWAPRCAETWTPWHFLNGRVQLPPTYHTH